MIKIAIAAAAGNIGSRAARQVALLGGTPLLLGRNIENLDKLNISGAVSIQTDISDTKQVVEATQGAEALLWLVPPLISVPNLKDWYKQVTTAGMAAVQENGIKRVVLISSLGAGARDNQGTVTYAGQMETEFDKLPANVLALRPGYFMENFLLQAQIIKAENTFSFTYHPEHDIPFISTDDIGNTAAKYLIDATWSGHWKLNLMGPKNISLNDAAAYISRLLDKQVLYKQVSVKEAAGQFANWGASSMVQQEFADLFLALGDTDGPYATPHTPEAYTPTSFDHFIKTKLLPLL